MSTPAHRTLDRLAREDAPRILAALARSTGGLDLAEDALQDALAAAATAVRFTTAAVLLPEPEVLALAALMLFHDARRSTRVDADGVPVALDEQSRSRWDRERIAEADGLIERALHARPDGPYAIQACIASLHAQARRDGLAADRAL